MQCRYCGAELPDGCAFCSQCGKPQQTEPAPPAPAAAPAETQATPAVPAQAPAAPRKSPLKIILGCLLVVVVLAVILAQCSAAAKAQMLETAKTFTLGGNEIELGEAVETNLTNVEWTCYENDDEFWTVTLSGYNPNEDAFLAKIVSAQFCHFITFCFTAGNSKSIKAPNFPATQIYNIVHRCPYNIAICIIKRESNLRIV